MTINYSYKALFALIILSLSLNVSANIIEFDAFKIRNNNSTITTPYDTDLVIVENAAGDGFYAETPRSGQKVGYGTNAFDGMQINSFTTVNWTTNSSATGAHPYLNMWVTDGSNYAVISSENAYMGTNFQTRNEWKIFEFGGPAGNFDWLLDSGAGSRTGAAYLQKNNVNVTLADFSNDIKLYAGPLGTTAGVGTGAPRGGFGFNVIFGDTQSNFIGSYFIENLTVAIGQTDYEAGNTTAVPEPSTLAIFALGILGFSIRRIKC